jgi:hypothetical protein
MQSTLFHRSLSFASAFCVALIVWSVTLAQAAEFKPFLTMQLAGPNALVTIAESVGIAVDPKGELGLREALREAAPYKRLQGVDPNGKIGLAIQVNEDSDFGLDLIAVLPISNFVTFNVPNPELRPMLNQIKGVFRAEGATKFVFDSPFGKIVAYQKMNFFIIATEGAAEYASTADPKRLFAEVDKFTFGMHANLENVSREKIEKVLPKFMMMLVMSGIEFEPEEFLDTFEDMFGEIASQTWGFTIDENNLAITATGQMTAKKGTELAGKFQNNMDAKTKLGAFLHDTPKTVFSLSVLEYLTDGDIEGGLISKSFLEGLTEAL